MYLFNMRVYFTVTKRNLIFRKRLDYNIILCTIRDKQIIILYWYIVSSFITRGVDDICQCVKLQFSRELKLESYSDFRNFFINLNCIILYSVIIQGYSKQSLSLAHH